MHDIFIFLVNGGWGNFTSDTACSRTCGSGIKTQSKACDSPKPKNGGATCKCEEEKLCDGMKAIIETECNLGPCPGNYL